MHFYGKFPQRPRLRRLVSRLGASALGVAFVLAAGGLSADSLTSSSGGFLYSNYLRQFPSASSRDGGMSAGSFIVRADRPFFASGKDAVGLAALGEIENLPLNRWGANLLDGAPVQDVVAEAEGRAEQAFWRLLDETADQVALAATEGARSRGTLRNVGVELRSDLGRDNSYAGLYALGALAEDARSAVAWEIRGYTGGSNTGQGGNIGLIYRRSLGLNAEGDDALAGFNVFLDYEQPKPAFDGLDEDAFYRWSAGGEFRSGWLDIHSNFYFRITDPVIHRTANGERYATYTAEGQEAEIAFHAPGYPDFSAIIGYYKWNGEMGDDDDDGLRAGVQLKPYRTPFSGRIEYGDAGDSRDFGGRIGFHYQFGAGPRAGAPGKPLFRPRDWFFAPAERSYVQRVVTSRIPDPLVWTLTGVSPAGSAISLVAGGITATVRMLNSGRLSVSGLGFVAPRADATEWLIPTSFPATVYAGEGVSAIMQYSEAGASSEVFVGGVAVLDATPRAILVEGSMMVSVGSGTFVAGGAGAGGDASLITLGADSVLNISSMEPSSASGMEFQAVLAGDASGAVTCRGGEETIDQIGVVCVIDPYFSGADGVIRGIYEVRGNRRVAMAVATVAARGGAGAYSFALVGAAPDHLAFAGGVVSLLPIDTANVGDMLAVTVAVSDSDSRTSEVTVTLSLLVTGMDSSAIPLFRRLDGGGAVDAGGASANSPRAVDRSAVSAVSVAHLAGQGGDGDYSFIRLPGSSPELTFGTGNIPGAGDVTVVFLQPSARPGALYTIFVRADDGDSFTPNLTAALYVLANLDSIGIRFRDIAGNIVTINSDRNPAGFRSFEQRAVPIGSFEAFGGSNISLSFLAGSGFTYSASNAFSGSLIAIAARRAVGEVMTVSMQAADGSDGLGASDASTVAVYYFAASEAVNNIRLSVSDPSFLSESSAPAVTASVGATAVVLLAADAGVGVLQYSKGPGSDVELDVSSSSGEVVFSVPARPGEVFSIAVIADDVGTDSEFTDAGSITLFVRAAYREINASFAVDGRPVANGATVTLASLQDMPRVVAVVDATGGSGSLTVARVEGQLSLDAASRGIFIPAGVTGNLTVRVIVSDVNSTATAPVMLDLAVTVPELIDRVTPLFFSPEPGGFELRTSQDRPLEITGGNNGRIAVAKIEGVGAFPGASYVFTSPFGDDHLALDSADDMIYLEPGATLGQVISINVDAADGSRFTTDGGNALFVLVGYPPLTMVLNGAARGEPLEGLGLSAESPITSRTPDATDSTYPAVTLEVSGGSGLVTVSGGGSGLILDHVDGTLVVVRMLGNLTGGELLAAFVTIADVFPSAINPDIVSTLYFRALPFPAITASLLGRAGRTPDDPVLLNIGSTGNVVAFTLGAAGGNGGDYSYSIAPNNDFGVSVFSISGSVALVDASNVAADQTYSILISISDDGADSQYTQDSSFTAYARVDARGNPARFFAQPEDFQRRALLLGSEGASAASVSMIADSERSNGMLAATFADEFSSLGHVGMGIWRYTPSENYVRSQLSASISPPFRILSGPYSCGADMCWQAGLAENAAPPRGEQGSFVLTMAFDVYNLDGVSVTQRLYEPSAEEAFLFLKHADGISVRSSSGAPGTPTFPVIVEMPIQATEAPEFPFAFATVSVQGEGEYALSISGSSLVTLSGDELRLVAHPPGGDHMFTLAAMLDGFPQLQGRIFEMALRAEPPAPDEGCLPVFETTTEGFIHNEPRAGQTVMVDGGLEYYFRQGDERHGILFRGRRARDNGYSLTNCDITLPENQFITPGEIEPSDQSTGEVGTRFIAPADFVIPSGHPAVAYSTGEAVLAFVPAPEFEGEIDSFRGQECEARTSSSGLSLSHCIRIVLNEEFPESPSAGTILGSIIVAGGDGMNHFIMPAENPAVNITSADGGLEMIVEGDGEGEGRIAVIAAASITVRGVAESGFIDGIVGRYNTSADSVMTVAPHFISYRFARQAGRTSALPGKGSPLLPFVLTVAADTPDSEYIPALTLFHASIITGAFFNITFETNFAVPEDQFYPISTEISEVPSRPGQSMTRVFVRADARNQRYELGRNLGDISRVYLDFFRPRSVAYAPATVIVSGDGSASSPYTIRESDVLGLPHPSLHVVEYPTVTLTHLGTQTLQISVAARTVFFAAPNFLALPLLVLDPKGEADLGIRGRGSGFSIVENSIRITHRYTLEGPYFTSRALETLTITHPSFHRNVFERRREMRLYANHRLPPGDYVLTITGAYRIAETPPHPGHGEPLAATLHIRIEEDAVYRPLRASSILLRSPVFRISAMPIIDDRDPDSRRIDDTTFLSGGVGDTELLLGGESPAQPIAFRGGTIALDGSDESLQIGNFANAFSNISAFLFSDSAGNPLSILPGEFSFRVLLYSPGDVPSREIYPAIRPDGSFYIRSLPALSQAGNEVMSPSRAPAAAESGCMGLEILYSENGKILARRDVYLSAVSTYDLRITDPFLSVAIANSLQQQEPMSDLRECVAQGSGAALAVNAGLVPGVRDIRFPLDSFGSSFFVLPDAAFPLLTVEVSGGSPPYHVSLDIAQRYDTGEPSPPDIMDDVMLATSSAGRFVVNWLPRSPDSNGGLSATLSVTVGIPITVHVSDSSVTLQRGGFTFRAMAECISIFNRAETIVQANDYNGISALYPGLKVLEYFEGGSIYFGDIEHLARAHEYFAYRGGLLAGDRIYHGRDLEKLIGVFESDGFLFIAPFSGNTTCESSDVGLHQFLAPPNGRITAVQQVGFRSPLLSAEPVPATTTVTIVPPFGTPADEDDLAAIRRFSTFFKIPFGKLADADYVKEISIVREGGVIPDLTFKMLPDRCQSASPLLCDIAPDFLFLDELTGRVRFSKQSSSLQPGSMTAWFNVTEGQHELVDIEYPVVVDLVASQPNSSGMQVRIGGTEVQTGLTRDNPILITLTGPTVHIGELNFRGSSLNTTVTTYQPVEKMISLSLPGASADSEFRAGHINPLDGEDPPPFEILANGEVRHFASQVVVDFRTTFRVDPPRGPSVDVDIENNYNGLHPNSDYGIPVEVGVPRHPPTLRQTLYIRTVM